MATRTLALLAILAVGLAVVACAPSSASGTVVSSTPSSAPGTVVDSAPSASGSGGDHTAAAATGPACLISLSDLQAATGLEWKIGPNTSDWGCSYLTTSTTGAVGISLFRIRDTPNARLQSVAEQACTVGTVRRLPDRPIAFTCKTGNATGQMGAVGVAVDGATEIFTTADLPMGEVSADALEDFLQSQLPRLHAPPGSGI